MAVDKNEARNAPLSSALLALVPLDGEAIGNGQLLKLFVDATAALKPPGREAEFDTLRRNADRTGLTHDGG